jgi:hypothetical protein
VQGREVRAFDLLSRLAWSWGTLIMTDWLVMWPSWAEAGEQAEWILVLGFHYRPSRLEGLQANHIQYGRRGDQGICQSFSGGNHGLYLKLRQRASYQRIERRTEGKREESERIENSSCRIMNRFSLRPIIASIQMHEIDKSLAN